MCERGLFIETVEQWFSRVGGLERNGIVITNEYGVNFWVLETVQKLIEVMVA